MTSLIPRTRRAIRPEAVFPSIVGDVDRLFGTVWRHGGQVPAATGEAFTFAPSLDVRDTDGAIEITADLPGLSEKDFEVVAENGVLTIRGERRSENEEAEAGRRWTERSYGRFERSVRLPEGADFTTAEASYANGVLTVKVPKADDASKVVKIAVQTS
jgi:HSP20 family protein